MRTKSVFFVLGAEDVEIGDAFYKSAVVRCCPSREAAMQEVESGSTSYLGSQ